MAVRGFVMLAPVGKSWDKRLEVEKDEKAMFDSTPGLV